MIAFTICARNFLAQAQVLHDGLRRHHPNLSFHVALCDELGELEPDAFPFSLMSLNDIGIPDIAGMIDRYNITELNRSIKPFVFLRLFDDFPSRPVVYFDPDIAILSTLTELEQALEQGADCVLTPHICEPAEYAEMQDGRMLQFGIYNLGFCALRDTPEVRRVVAWWGRRLERQCIIDLQAGLFVDQKWADLLPAFIDHTFILRHPGYNVGYWNLSQRTVRRIDGEVGGERSPVAVLSFQRQRRRPRPSRILTAQQRVSATDATGGRSAFQGLRHASLSLRAPALPFDSRNYSASLAGQDRFRRAAMWLMLQQSGPDDVIASGEQHSVREFVEQAFRVAGVGVAAGATISGQPAKGRTLVRIDPRYLRPTEVATLLGDPSEAPAKLGWRPSISFEGLVEETVEAQLREAERDQLVKKRLSDL